MNVSPHSAQDTGLTEATPGFPLHKQPGASHPPDPTGDSRGLTCTITTCQQEEHKTAPDAGATRPSSQSLASIATIPDELLCHIFSLLPVSTHSQCALVCRRWYARLPDTRLRVMRWLKQYPYADIGNPDQLAAAYSCRTRPWFARFRHPFLPVLDRQHQELLRLRQCPPQEPMPDPRAGAAQQEQIAHQMLSSLIQYSLQREIPPGQLSPRIVAMPCPPTERVLTFSTSPCCRWLAMRCQRAPDSICLRLYGWQSGNWQEQTLLSQPDQPAATCGFAHLQLNRLFSIHGHDVLVWQPQPDTGLWFPTLLYSVQSPYRPFFLALMHNGDFVSLSYKEDEHAHYVIQTSRYRADQDSWELLPDRLYANTRQWIALTLGTDLLALVFGTVVTRESPLYNNALLLWGKGFNADHPEAWSAQWYFLKHRNSALVGIEIGPGARHLLGLLLNRRLCLWELDTQNKILVAQREIQCDLTFPLSGVAAAPFRSDGRQLALPGAPYRIQLWDLDDSGQWHCGATLETPPSLREHVGHRIRSLILATDGRTLVRLTEKSVTIWRQDACGHWHFVTQRHTHSANASPPGASLLPCGAVCTTAGDAEPGLWIHVPDHNGQLVRQVSLPTDHSLINTTTDGLTLILGHGEFLSFLHLTGPGNAAVLHRN
ncbi:MAG: F-box protein [Kistimonas sp.]|nr:F-box protein [Kistimonas sp.]